MTYIHVLLLPLEVCYGKRAVLLTTTKRASGNITATLATIVAILFALCEIALADTLTVTAVKRSNDPMSLALWSPPPTDTHWVHNRSEEHTSELQSLMRISYAVFCLKKKIIKYTHN